MYSHTAIRVLTIKQNGFRGRKKCRVLLSGHPGVNPENWLKQPFSLRRCCHLHLLALLLLRSLPIEPPPFFARPVETGHPHRVVEVAGIAPASETHPVGRNYGYILLPTRISGLEFYHSQRFLSCLSVAVHSVLFLIPEINPGDSP